jgi:hypothetical protein
MGVPSRYSYFVLVVDGVWLWFLVLRGGMADGDFDIEAYLEAQVDVSTTLLFSSLP